MTRPQTLNPITLKYLPAERRSANPDPTDLTAVTKRVAPYLLSIATKMKRPWSWEIEDLLNVGLIAAFSAAKTFDASKGEFGAYAGVAGKRAMIDACLENMAAVRLNETTISRNKKQGRDMLAEFGVVSMARPDAHGNPLEDTIASPETRSPEDVVDANRLLRRMSTEQRELCAELVSGVTQVEIAQREGASRQAVQQRFMAIRNKFSAVAEGAADTDEMDCAC